MYGSSWLPFNFSLNPIFNSYYWLSACLHQELIKTQNVVGLGYFSLVYHLSLEDSCLIWVSPSDDNLLQVTGKRNYCSFLVYPQSHCFTGIRTCFFRILTYTEAQQRHPASGTEQLLDSGTLTETAIVVRPESDYPFVYVQISFLSSVSPENLDTSYLPHLSFWLANLTLSLCFAL